MKKNYHKTCECKKLYIYLYQIIKTMKKLKIDKTLLIKCYIQLSIYQMLYPVENGDSVIEVIQELEELIEKDK